MNHGWICLHRKIREHPLWPAKHFSPLEAWLDILLSANHAASRVLIDGKFVEIERGAFVTSEVKLAERWGWARKTVRRFLSSLEMDRMIAKKCTTRYTAIEVQNYALYQNFEIGEDTAMDTGREQVNTQMGNSNLHTNNNNNNDNNSKRITYMRAPSIPYTEIQEIWNSHRGAMPAIREMDMKRQRSIKALWAKHPTIDWFRDLFQAAANSDFLCGRVTDKPFVAGFDFVIKNAVKIIEGTYSNRSARLGYKPSEQDWDKYEL